MKNLIILFLFLPIGAFAQRGQLTHPTSRIDTLHCNFWFITGKTTDTIWGGYMLTGKWGTYSARHPKDSTIFTNKLYQPIPNAILGYKAIPK